MRIPAITVILLLGACAPAADQSDSETAIAAPTPPTEVSDRQAVDSLSEQAVGSINPFENDLRGLEVAIRLRDEFRTHPDGVKFEFGVVTAQGDKPLDEVFTLEPTSGIDSLMIASQQREGFHIRTYRLTEADKPRMAAADATLQALKAASTGGNELQFQAVALTCVEPEVKPPEAYSLTLYVRTHTNVDFIALSGEIRLDRKDEEAVSEIFEVCASAD